MSDYSELKRLAEDTRRILRDSFDLDELEVASHKFHNQITPEVVIALIAENDRLEQECENARRTAEYWKAEHVAGNALIEQLKRNCDLLEKQRDEAGKAADSAIEKCRVKDEFYQDALHSHIKLREDRDAALKQVEELRALLSGVCDYADGLLCEVNHSANYCGSTGPDAVHEDADYMAARAALQAKP